ncbi:MAG: ATP-binding protein [Myxococcota bacterium]|jgi:hypothetical protein|nr:ATP-binding protein [Myxococcota bacterium]
MPRRIVAMLEPLLEQASHSPASTRRLSVSDQAARALLLRYLLRLRPWRLAAAQCKLEQELRESMLLSWLKGRGDNASLLRCETMLDALIQDAGQRARQPGETGQTPSTPPLLGSSLASSRQLDAIDIALLDLLHAASGERPDLVAILAELGCLRPARVRAGASLAASVLRAALGPKAAARLQRLARLGLVAHIEGLDDREGYVQIPWPLQQLWNAERPLRSPLALDKGVSIWPLGPSANPTLLHAIWPQLEKTSALAAGAKHPAAALSSESPTDTNTSLSFGSGRWLLVGGEEEAMHCVAWCTEQEDRIAYQIELDAEGSMPAPWLSMARQLRPGPLLLKAGRAELNTFAFRKSILGPGPVFLHRPHQSAITPAEELGWRQLELEGGDLWSHAVAARLGGIEARLATLWNEGLGQLSRPVRRAALLLELERSQPRQKELLRAALDDISNQRMQSVGLQRIVEPAAPDIMPAATAEQMSEVLTVVRMCGEARRGERARGMLPSRSIIILEGERSILQRRALWKLGLAWGQAVYEIDISQVLSRYIGEAEERLATIFAHARSSGCALFIDEAQGLLGKRTDMKRSVDRYSTMQVQSALQSLEDFEGLLILSCSSGDELDSGVLSRALFRVRFHTLSQQERAAFWTRSLPPQAPLSDDIDWEVIAEDFLLDADQILRAGLLAAIDAARLEREIDHELLCKACAASAQRSS